MEIRKIKQSRLELGSCKAIVHGKGVRRQSCMFPEEEYCVPDYMKDFIKRIDTSGKFELVENENFYADAFGRVTELYYYARSTTDPGVKPDLVLTFEDFSKLGRPRYLLVSMEEISNLRPLKKYNESI